MVTMRALLGIELQLFGLSISRIATVKNNLCDLSNIEAKNIMEAIVSQKCFNFMDLMNQMFRL